MADILIVDDETAIADLVEVCLQNEGFTVHKFYNACDALACVESRPLDLAILDVMLPDMDGFALCQKIRQNHLFPIIMLTARVEDMDKIMGQDPAAALYPLQPGRRARAKTRRARYPRAGYLESQPQMHALRRGTGPDAAGVFDPLVSVRAAGAGCLERGAVRGGLGRKVHRFQQHGHVSHCPAARKDARTEPQTQIYQDGLGGGLHH